MSSEEAPIKCLAAESPGVDSSFELGKPKCQFLRVLIICRAGILLFRFSVFFLSSNTRVECPECGSLVREVVMFRPLQAWFRHT